MVSISIPSMGFITCHLLNCLLLLPLSLVSLFKLFHVDLQEKGQCKAWPRNEWPVFPLADPFQNHPLSPQPRAAVVKCKC